MRYMIGIDNGLKGGIACVDEGERIVTVVPMPVLKGKKTDYDISTIKDMFTALKRMGHMSAVIEQAHVRPICGKRASYSIGMSYGLMLGILNALGIGCVVVSPTRWMNDILKGNLRKEYKGSMRYCQLKYPDTNFHEGKSKKMHDGMTDAVCIALWGMRNTGQMPSGWKVPHEGVVEHV